jgi:hypothetical protein
VAAVKVIIGSAAGLLVAGFLHADSELTSQFNYYTDSAGIAVMSPRVQAETDLDERSKLGLGYTIDAVSGASFNYAQSKTHKWDPRRQPGTCKTCHMGVDAISGASRNYRDNRHDLNVSVTRKVGETDLRPAYIRSEENDYLSETLSLGVTQALFSRNSTLSLSVRRMSDVIRPTWNKAKVHELSTHGAALGLTQVLTKVTMLRLGADVADMQGYLANPYAFVQVGNLDTLPFAETHPEQRQRIDLSAGLKQSLGWDSSLELGYRWYNDSWDVHAHTIDAQLAKTWGAFTLEAGWRHYQQTAAWFYQDRYWSPQAYLSRDLKLAAFTDDMLSLGFRGALGEHWSTELRYGFLRRQDDLDYSLLFADGPVTGHMAVLGFSYQ